MIGMTRIPPHGIRLTRQRQGLRHASHRAKAEPMRPVDRDQEGKQEQSEADKHQRRLERLLRLHILFFVIPQRTSPNQSAII